ncbi:MAG: ATP-binding cassette domain-containing protein [Nitrospiraceae bacterium]|nr:ATP-binding cassette domain-containing protein [Nitrospiraceae bacterium]
MLRAKNLRITSAGREIVKDISFSVSKGEKVSMVGESGSGKSLSALSILKLLPEPLRCTGNIDVDGINMGTLNGEELRNLRWKKVSMVFQDPQSTFNPLMTIGSQILDAVKAHRIKDGERPTDLLKLCKVPNPIEVANAYPHQLSGGLKQRAAIAMAISCKPDYILADEPTTSLDVTVQEEILGVLSSLKSTGILLTHDIAVASSFSNRMNVVYAGYLMESGKTTEVMEKPLHPYTKALIKCTPKLNAVPKKKLFAIKGKSFQNSHGCPFSPRCPFAMDICERNVPLLRKVGNRFVRCFLYQQ